MSEINYDLGEAGTKDWFSLLLTEPENQNGPIPHSPTSLPSPQPRQALKVLPALYLFPRFSAH